MPKSFLIKREPSCLMNGSIICQNVSNKQDQSLESFCNEELLGSNKIVNKEPIQQNGNFMLKSGSICKFSGLKLNAVRTNSNFSIKDILLLDRNNDQNNDRPQASFASQNRYQYSPLSEVVIPSPQASISSIEEENEDLLSIEHPIKATKIFFPCEIKSPSNNLNTFRQYQCEVCLKRFQRSSSLSNHRLIHKNNKSYECKQCGTCFLRKSDLEKHVIIHSGNKPYQCHTCGKRFSQSSNMLTHQRRHTGVRPYSCSFCGKCFYRKVDVRRHATIHRAN